MKAELNQHSQVLREKYSRWRDDHARGPWQRDAKGDFDQISCDGQKKRRYINSITVLIYNLTI